MREDASCCRPRLYDHEDPERRDDVELVLEAIDTQMEMAMAVGDKEAVEHASDLKRRLINSAGDYYESHGGDPTEDDEE